MAYQNLFEALINVCDFTALESDLTEIILAYKKDLAEQLSQTKRKIIGYKAPFDMFGGIIKSGSLYIKKREVSLYYYTQDNCSSMYYLPAEIVETWEPVYEDEKLEVIDWNWIYNDTQTEVVFKGKLTQEIVDKIKEVINE